MKRFVACVVTVFVSQSVMARSIVKPIETTCKDELTSVSNALNACPDEVKRIAEGYKFGRIEYRKSQRPDIIPNSDTGDVVNISIIDSKGQYSGYFQVEFGPRAADGGPKHNKCTLKISSRPSLDNACSMEDVVCTDDQKKEPFVDKNGCTKNRCVPKNTVISQ